MEFSQLGIFVVFVISLVAVSKGADWLVDSAVWIATILGIPHVIVGATIVSLGTTLPEALISILAAVQDKGDVVLGTTIGSCIFNTAVILGLAVLIKPIKLKDKDTLLRAGTMVGTLVLFTILSIDGFLSRFDSVILLIVLAFYLGTSIWSGMTAAQQNNKATYTRSELIKNLRNLVIGTVFLATGANYLLESGAQIASFFGVSEAVIAITMFAVGSSLPELITGLNASIKGHGGIVLGNIFGANTLNLIFAVGISGLIQPFSVASSVFAFDIPASFLVMATMLIPVLFIRRISRIQGLITIILYLFYIYIVISST